MILSCGRRIVVLGSLVAASLVTASIAELRAASVEVPSSKIVAPESASAARVIRDSLSGRSGKLWMRLVSEKRTNGIGVLRRLFGDSATDKPGVYTHTDSAGRPFSFVTLVPFDSKARGTVGTYRMGLWPAERRKPRSEAYTNPDGFIEVTAENQDTPVSEHFRLRDFLTHDQKPVWPKYLVLSESLIDKLELAITELKRRGLNAERLVVMSGFRTPQYNAKGVRPGGRAKDSRHQFGDAADVFVDTNGDGRMDDLNGDGRVNNRDARMLAQVIEGVEKEHEELVGGLGIYPATRSHGPFVHVDVRGVPARWGLR